MSMEDSGKSVFSVAEEDNANYDSIASSTVILVHSSNKGKLTPMLVLTTLTLTMVGSFQFGYQVGVPTGPSDIMKAFYNQSNFERRGAFLSDNAVLWLWSFTVSLFCIGGAIGALLSGYMADLLGRKGATMLVNVFSILAGILGGLSLYANNYEMVLIYRTVIGFYAGVSVTIIPLYLAEVSPVNLRGAIGTIHQLMITIGILIGQALGLFAFNTETGWPILLALTAAPSILQLFVLPLCPESPRWLLLNKNKEEECRKALAQLRGTSDVDHEIMEMKREAESESGVEKFGIWSVLTLQKPEWKQPLLICCMLHLCQQFSGINAVLFYATDIYEDTGMDADQVAYSTIGTGGVNVVMTIIAVYVVESWGRRPLLLYPFVGLTVTTALLTVTVNLQDKVDWMKWMSLVIIYLYIISFAIGPGPIPFVIGPELWEQGPRSAAISIGVQVNWYSNFIVNLIFPSLQETIGAYAFLLFMVFCLLGTVFTFFKVPETKGKTFDEIQENFRGKKSTASKNDYEMS